MKVRSDLVSAMPSHRFLVDEGADLIVGKLCDLHDLM